MSQETLDSLNSFGDCCFAVSSLFAARAQQKNPIMLNSDTSTERRQKSGRLLMKAPREKKIALPPSVKHFLRYVRSLVLQAGTKKRADAGGFVPYHCHPPGPLFLKVEHCSRFTREKELSYLSPFQLAQRMMARELTKWCCLLHGHCLRPYVKPPHVCRRLGNGVGLWSCEKERFTQRNHKDTAVHADQDFHGGPSSLPVHIPL